MVCGVGSTLIGVKNGLIHTQIVHLKGIDGFHSDVINSEKSK